MMKYGDLIAVSLIAGAVGYSIGGVVGCCIGVGIGFLLFN
jgi:hypothetical protein